ncbi:MAG: cell division protein FtsQ/DivIB [Pseudomonadota bacterium]|nr:cell division protein FtsQ/DivIB [Pseudomonadota bacterium]
MNAAVRSSSVSRRKSAPKSVSKRIAAKLPVHEAEANRWARRLFLLFVLAIVAVAVVALDLPAKAGLAAGEALGRAGFAVDGYQIVGLNKMKRSLVDEVVTDELHKAALAGAGSGKPAEALVDVSAIRDRLLHYGWVKDARVSRRLPDGLVIDIVERTPAALWQDNQQLSLIDRSGVVLDRVPVSQMPDLPLLIGPGANGKAEQLERLLDTVATLKPQLAAATWVGQRRWDLSFQTGEVVVLPEGEDAARDALDKFARLDKSAGLLGRGLKRFDLRQPGKMTVRLPRAPGEAIAPAETVANAAGNSAPPAPTPPAATKD